MVRKVWPLTGTVCALNAGGSASTFSSSESSPRLRLWTCAASWRLSYVPCLQRPPCPCLFVQPCASCGRRHAAWLSDDDFWSPPHGGCRPAAIRRPAERASACAVARLFKFFGLGCSYRFVAVRLLLTPLPLPPAPAPAASRLDSVSTAEAPSALTLQPRRRRCRRRRRRQTVRMRPPPHPHRLRAASAAAVVPPPAVAAAAAASKMERTLASTRSAMPCKSSLSSSFYSLVK